MSQLYYGDNYILEVGCGYHRCVKIRPKSLHGQSCGPTVFLLPLFRVLHINRKNLRFDEDIKEQEKVGATESLVYFPIISGEPRKVPLHCPEVTALK